MKVIHVTMDDYDDPLLAILVCEDDQVEATEAKLKEIIGKEEITVEAFTPNTIEDFKEVYDEIFGDDPPERPSK